MSPTIRIKAGQSVLAHASMICRHYAVSYLTLSQKRPRLSVRNSLATIRAQSRPRRRGRQSRSALCSPTRMSWQPAARPPKTASTWRPPFSTRSCAAVRNPARAAGARRRTSRRHAGRHVAARDRRGNADEHLARTLAGRRRDRPRGLCERGCRRLRASRRGRSLACRVRNPTPRSGRESPLVKEGAAPEGARRFLRYPSGATNGAGRGHGATPLGAPDDRSSHWLSAAMSLAGPLRAVIRPMPTARPTIR
jgi:hypothetical protein